MSVSVQEYRPLDTQMAHENDYPCWILLRGLARESRHWGDFGQRLADTLRARVLCPDLPGNGQLYRTSSPVQLGALVDQLRNLLQPLYNGQPTGPGYPLSLLGLSMGAMVSSAWALRYPAEVERIVLINSSLARLSPPWQRLRPGAWVTLARALLTDRAHKEALIYRLSCQRHSEVTLAQWCEYAHECPLSGRNALRQLAAAALYRGGGQAPAAPALVLCSSADAMVNPACSAAIARHWNAPLCIHPGAGHDLPHDAPDWVLAHVSGWLQQLR